MTLKIVLKTRRTVLKTLITVLRMLKTVLWTLKTLLKTLRTMLKTLRSMLTKLRTSRSTSRQGGWLLLSSSVKVGAEGLIILLGGADGSASGKLGWVWGVGHAGGALEPGLPAGAAGDAAGAGRPSATEAGQAVPRGVGARACKHVGNPCGRRLELARVGGGGCKGVGRRWVPPRVTLLQASPLLPDPFDCACPFLHLLQTLVYYRSSHSASDPGLPTPTPSYAPTQPLGPSLLWVPHPSPRGVKKALYREEARLLEVALTVAATDGAGGERLPAATGGIEGGGS
ncbi:hypothetical protein V8C86DRAFT_108097 [Haematococcus lacustris]